MKNIIRFTAVLLLCAVMLLPSGCGSEFGNLSFGLSEFGETLIGAGLFSEEMLTFETDAAVKTYGLEGADEAMAWAGSGAFAEEIVVVKGNPEGNLRKLQDHLAAQKVTYNEYKVEEMPKLKSAVLKTAGEYAVYVVSNDNAKADELVSDFLRSHAK